MPGQKLGGVEKFWTPASIAQTTVLLSCLQPSKLDEMLTIAIFLLFFVGNRAFGSWDEHFRSSGFVFYIAEFLHSGQAKTGFRRIWLR